jgi:hypothetical protein
MRRLLLLLSMMALVFAASAAAQNNCVSVRGMTQQHLLDLTSPDWLGGYPGAPWVGPVQLILGDNEVLVGKVSENDGSLRKTDHQEMGGYFVFDFGAEGSFTLQTDNSVFPPRPKYQGIAAAGVFHGQGPVGTLAEIPGTGRFANATGTVFVKGDFIAWNLTAPLPSGRANFSITGLLCNVTP